MSIYKWGQSMLFERVDFKCNLLFIHKQGRVVCIGCVSNNIKDKYVDMGWNTKLYKYAGITYLKFNQNDSQSLIEEGKYYKIYIGEHIIYTTKSFGEWFYKAMLVVKNKPENTGVFSVG